MKDLTVTSQVFQNQDSIPQKYTCDGVDVSPPLQIEGIPEDAKSLVLIVDDPDAPMGNWDHWIVWNIPPTGTIEEGVVPGKQGTNDFQKTNYGGPCPPSGTHRYFFKVFALDCELDLKESARKSDVESAMEGKIVAKGVLVGLYSRS